MGFSDDTDNDLPDWLSELGSGEDDQEKEYGQGSGFDSEKDQPDWINNDLSGDLGAEQAGEDDVPDWLSDIREKEEAPQKSVSITPEDLDSDEDAWLEGIRQQQSGSGTDELAPADIEQSEADFLEKIRVIKAEEEQSEALGDNEETIRLQDYWARQGQPMPQPEDLNEPTGDEEESPDWVSGLPAMDLTVEDSPPPAFAEPVETGQDEADPSWLKNIREQHAQDNPLEEDLPEEDQAEDEPAEQDSSAAAFTENPNVTGSLPSWMESLQTSGLVLYAEQAEEEDLQGAGYSQEELSNLFEQDDLPDWLGSDSTPAGEAPGPFADGEETGGEANRATPERKIERAELPGWLQAIRPMEAVTSAAVDQTAASHEDEGDLPEKERVGPLSGLRNVLPAEPVVVNFGSPSRAIPGFELTDVQKQYTQMLKAMVADEQASVPSERRRVANPQQILRWMIAILLLSFTFAALWLSPSFGLALPDPARMPPENLAVVSRVNALAPGDRVLIAVEYQPGLSAEMEAASAALFQHLLLREAELVLVSSQPVGPGLGEAFLQEQFGKNAYIQERRYVNLGYVSGGAAGLLQLASNIRQTKADMAWDQPPLAGVESIRDFAMVLVITDDPDIARSWVEQVQPILDPADDGQGVPLAMVVSAQAEPLVYPYYYTNPQQITGLISGISGGAYYETVIGPQVASSFWTAYNTGLVLAVFVIAIGSIINLARNSLQGLGKGRS